MKDDGSSISPSTHLNNGVAMSLSLNITGWVYD